MKKNNLILLIIIAFSFIELIIIKPLIPGFYVMNFWGKLLYIIGMYGFPVYIILPIGVIMTIILLPLIRKDDFLARLSKLTRKTYFAFSILILFLSSLLVFSKIGLHKDPFPLIPYASIKRTQHDISDIKIGTFTTKNYIIKRDRTKELVISKTSNDTTICDLTWISGIEYVVKSRINNKWLKDNSTRIVITNNQPDFYECYTKYGDYAVYGKIFKK